MSLTLLWIPVTLVAAVAQTARNATQRKLTETIGTVGATQVRFLYGFPFALLALAFVRLVTLEIIPSITGPFIDALRHAQALVCGGDRLHQD